MDFKVNIDVYINNIQVVTVNSITIKDEHNNLGKNCDIMLPLTCKFFNKNQYLIDNPKNQFIAGQSVQILASYDFKGNQMTTLTLFEGFVYDFVEGIPLKMRCMDYAYNLKIAPIVGTSTVKGLNYQTGTISKVINDLLKNTGIILAKEHIDFDIQDLSFTNVNPYYCLEWIKKELGITVHLFGNELYFNLAANVRNPLQAINLRTDCNVIASAMQKQDSAFQKFKVQVNYLNVNKLKNVVEKGDATGETHTVNLYCIAKQTATQTTNFNKLVDNSLNNLKLSHYAGKLTTLLYPQINLFEQINYVDISFPDRNGVYIVRGLTMTIDMNGIKQENDIAWLSTLPLSNEDLNYINAAMSVPLN